MEISDGLKSAARAEADRFPRYFQRISHIDFVFEEDHHQVCTEIITSTVMGKKIVATSEDHDPYKSLKEASQKVARQLKKFNERLHENRGTSDQSTSPNPANRDRPGAELPDDEF